MGVPLVTIILVNWQGWRDTLACLDSLSHLRYPNYHVAVVDNGSGDDSVDKIKHEYSDLELIENPTNVGFARGCNCGIKRAMAIEADYVWLLNNDTIVDPNALSAMVNLAEEDVSVAAVGASVYSMKEPHVLQVWGGGQINSWLGRSAHRLIPGPIEYITGASMLLRVSALHDVGLLDERYFMYWEETDLCFRLRKHGWKVAVSADSRVYHKESASLGGASPQKDALYSESAVLFFRAHAPVPWLSITMGAATRVVKRVLYGNVRGAMAVLSGTLRGIRER